jgi:hypothetical protein
MVKRAWAQIFFFYVHVTVHRDTWPASWHVTVHRDKFLIINQIDALIYQILFWKWNSTCFGQFLCPSSGVIHCTLSNGICSSSSSRILLESCLQTFMTYTIAECTVNNSWWWTEELSETCRVSFQNKIEKLVHLVGFIIRNGHNYSKIHNVFYKETFLKWVKFLPDDAPVHEPKHVATLRSMCEKVKAFPVASTVSELHHQTRSFVVTFVTRTHSSVTVLQFIAVRARLVRALNLIHFLLLSAHQSVHRESIFKNVPADDTFLCSILFPVNGSTCFGWNIHPSSGARVNCSYSIW